MFYKHLMLKPCITSDQRWPFWFLIGLVKYPAGAYSVTPFRHSVLLSFRPSVLPDSVSAHYLSHTWRFSNEIWYIGLSRWYIVDLPPCKTSPQKFCYIANIPLEYLLYSKSSPTEQMLYSKTSPRRKICYKANLPPFIAFCPPGNVCYIADIPPYHCSGKSLFEFIIQMSHVIFSHQWCLLMVYQKIMCE